MHRLLTLTSLPVRGIAICVAALPVAALPVVAIAAAPPGTFERSALSKAVERVEAGLVRVELRLRPDRGESPTSQVGQRWCTSCGTYHGEQASELISQERPLEVAGFLVAPDMVVARDPALLWRFVDTITVLGPEGSTSATVDGVALDEPAVYLRLAEPLAGAAPLRFAPAPNRPGTSQEANDPMRPVASVRWTPEDGVWKVTASGPTRRTVVERRADGSSRTWTTGESDALTVAADGTVVGFSLRGRLPDDEVQSVDPMQWPRLDGAARLELLDATRREATEGLLRTTLHFRSPRQQRGERFGYGEGPTVGTEVESIGVMVREGSSGAPRLVILSGLDQSATARLERIEVHAPTGESHDATFLATLRELSALVAEVPAALSSDGGAVSLSTHDPVALRDRLLPAAYTRVLGRQLVVDPELVRFVGFARGWQGISVPTGVPDDARAFVFDPLESSPTLLALPVATRQKVAVRDRWSSESPMLLPATRLAALLADLDAASDPSNIPLNEEEEGRTAWIGVMLQPLDSELAAANNVAELTRDGEFGGIVTFVYPGSPAEAAGIQPGELVLAIHATGQPKPIEIEVAEEDLGYPGVFPWEHLDDLPEEYFDSIPAPWPAIDDVLAKALRDLGFGTAYELEVFSDGASRRVPFEVVQSPPHFGNAPRYENKAIGLTVRDLTMEVRNYLGLAAESSGVVVAGLEPGMRASVAGIRPFEVITQVDDQPVADIKAFEQALEGQSDLRFTVRRANRDRVVRVAM